MNLGAFGRLAALWFACAISAAAQAATILHFTSSPQSWIGQGETVTVTPADGFAFSVSRNFDNGVSFHIDDWATNPDFSQARWWFLDLSAPFDTVLSPGFYGDATRWPFQEPSEPGLAFGGNGRGNNTLTGHFQVLEAVYAPDGSVLSFAADFTQFDEGFRAWWNVGAIRFNSDVPIVLSPVSEPAPWALLLAALLGLGFRRRGGMANLQPPCTGEPDSRNNGVPPLRLRDES